MAQALTAPFLTAALVLCVAGLAKLRTPETAVGALRAAGLPGSSPAVRGFALAELGLGIWAVAHPVWTNAAAVAFLYAVFSGLSLFLARRRASCGCFGDGGVPASSIQALLSAALAAVAVTAAIGGAHGLSWVVGQPPGQAATLIVAVAGTAYAAVIAYTALPTAWAAWSGR